MQTPINEQYYSLLLQLQELDFVLVELNLYLDTHPGDAQAIQQYNQLVHQRMQLAHHFEANFGPLMHFGHSHSRSPWEWNNVPWPWQV